MTATTKAKTMTTDTTIQELVRAAVDARNASRKTLCECIAETCSELPVGSELDCGISVIREHVACSQWADHSRPIERRTRTILLRGRHVWHKNASHFDGSNMQHEFRGPPQAQAPYADIRSLCEELPESLARWVEAAYATTSANAAAAAALMGM